MFDHKLPPHNIESEMCVLGSLMLAGDDRRLQSEVFATVSPDDFYDPEHGTLFRVLHRLHAEDRPIDAMIVRQEIGKLPKEDRLDDDYLLKVLSSVPNAGNGAEYGKEVRDCAVRRRAIVDVAKATHLLYDRSQSAGETIERLIAGLAGSGTRSGKLDIVKLEDVLYETIEQMEKGSVKGLRSNYAAIAEAIGVYGDGEMTLVAGRPSSGKSCIVKDEVRMWAHGGVVCGIIPLEETKAMIARKYLSAEASIDNYKVRDGGDKLKGEWPKILAANARLAKLPIYIADGAFTTGDVVSAANMLVARHGCRVVVVDHMHLMQQEGDGDDVAKLSEISRTLKHTIKRLDVVGMIVAQLNRGNTKRDDKRPTMSDVRGCGSIEQDVDTMLLLHREDYYQADKNKHTGLAEIIIAKARDGRTGAVDLKFNGKYQRFEDVGPLDPFM